MDFGRGLSYIRRDPNWIVKVLLGSVISFVPILNFAAIGYALNTERNIYEGRETPLPEWGENFGDYFVRGLFGVVIQFIYALPAIAVACVYVALVVGAAAATGDSSSSDSAGAGISMMMLCLYPLLFVVGLACGIVGMVAQARYAISNNFSAALRFGEVFQELRQNFASWVLALVMMMIVGFGLGIVTLFTCGLGSLLSFYATLAGVHWAAQAYHASNPSRLEPGTI